MNYLVIDDATDTIDNIIVCDPGQLIDPGAGKHLEPALTQCGIGWRRIDGVWTAP